MAGSGLSNTTHLLASPDPDRAADSSVISQHDIYAKHQ
jgi:hypothetical protein